MSHGMYHHIVLQECSGCNLCTKGHIAEAVKKAKKAGTNLILVPEVKTARADHKGELEW